MKSHRIFSINQYSLFSQAALCTLLSILSLGCNNAKAINIDSSSSAIGALVLGPIANDWNTSNGTSSGPTSTVSVTVSGYTGLTAKPMNLTLTDSVTSATDTLQITANGTFAFSTALDTGNGYSVSLGTYTGSTGGQTCTLTGTTGTAGTTANSTVACERQLAMAATWKSDAGTQNFRLLGIDHSQSPYNVNSNVALSVGGSPSNVDPELVWGGGNYLLVWKSADNTIKGQLYNIELTAVGSTFQVYSATGVTIGKLAAAYNQSNEFAVVWTELGSVNTSFRYQRIDATTGSLSGSATNIATTAITSANYYNGDVVYDGSQYIAAMRITTTLGVHSIYWYSFTPSGGSIKGNYSSKVGTTSYYLRMDYPSMIVSGTDVWTFLSRTNVDTTGSVVDASVVKIKNYASSSASPIATDTNPYGCGPADGDQYYIPSAGIYGTNILVGYDVFCGDVGGTYNDVHDVPVNATTGAAGGVTTYSDGEIGSETTYGSSTTCRSNTCFMSAGDEYNDVFYLFDPFFTTSPYLGDVGGTSVLYVPSGGVQFPKTVIE
ncbi:hypothetical protein EHQ53_05195 [Leptospira langatensis]|uniref:Lipoprotein n=1 Tax=Leptospira langatensis TaxID=2484983 RepID=A0A5F1ZT73_9LEPT|nr:hypothetical protein [Leptospira langatensis]TGK02870.1 hypothetical protein EHO57_06030 [Leptospira langatensis]TGL41624.1 hypothetical protein EHQ53_05195 [Leptospira langatensis]